MMRLLTTCGDRTMDVELKCFNMASTEHEKKSRTKGHVMRKSAYVLHCKVLQTNLHQVHNKYIIEHLFVKTTNYVFFCTERVVHVGKGHGLSGGVFIFFSTAASKIHPAHVVSVIYPVGGVNDRPVLHDCISTRWTTFPLLQIFGH